MEQLLYEQYRNIVLQTIIFIENINERSEQLLPAK